MQRGRVRKPGLDLRTPSVDEPAGYGVSAKSAPRLAGSQSRRATGLRHAPLVVLHHLQDSGLVELLVYLGHHLSPIPATSSDVCVKSPSASYRSRVRRPTTSTGESDVSQPRPEIASGSAHAVHLVGGGLPDLAACFGTRPYEVIGEAQETEKPSLQIHLTVEAVSHVPSGRTCSAIAWSTRRWSRAISACRRRRPSGVIR